MQTATFVIGIYRSNNVRTGWSVQAIFQISLNEKDKTILEGIQNYGKGSIVKNRSDSLSYSVKSIKDLASIIDHFDISFNYTKMSM